MKLIVGLGNPGREYVNTRHNIGFMYLDYIFGDKFVTNNKFKAMEYITTINGEKVIVIKPLTYMNLSGEAVIKYVNYYKIQEEDILVIQDDLDMDVGRIKLLFNHGAGGHNGIKNIISHFGTEEFLRIKIGVGEKPQGYDLADYVLSYFDKKTRDIIDNSLADVKNVVETIITEGYESAANKFN